MIKKFFIFCIVSLALFAAETTTQVSFESEVPAGEDSFGNTLYDRSVKIETNNFKVDNFWSKFSFAGSGKTQTEVNSLSKTGTVRISVESTSICSFYSELDKNGCSGQKPFLINNEALSGVSTGDTISLIFQKDYDLTSDTILYKESNATVFYPLDIQRTEKYYKTQADNTKSFFGIFSLMFNTFFGDSGFFSTFFSHAVNDKNNAPAEDIRQRYIANIVSGIDQEHLLKKNATALQTATLNSPVSLIDYMENTTSAGSCNLFFFKFSQNSPFCSFMSGMPFISMFSSTKPTTTYTIDTIQSDTENALVTFASSYTDMTLTQYQDGTVYQEKIDPSLSINPISMMINMMKCFFFGCGGGSDTNKIEIPSESYYAFSDESAVNLMFAVTNSGTQIDDFQIFKLKGIHSLTGSERMCRVKESNSYDTWTDYTFKPSGSDAKTFTDLGSVVSETWCRSSSGVESKKTGFFCPFGSTQFTKVISGQVLKTPSEWLDWCDAAIENSVPTTHTQCDYLFFMPYNCREVTDPIVVDGYEIAEYVNSSKRGLVLDLELTELNTSSKAATLRYQLISTEY